MFFLYGMEALLTIIIVIMGLVFLYKLMMKYLNSSGVNSQSFPLTSDRSGVLWTVNSNGCHTRVYIDNYDIEIQIQPNDGFYSVYMNDVCIRIESSSIEDVQQKTLKYIQDEYNRSPRSQFAKDLLFSKLRA